MSAGAEGRAAGDVEVEGVVEAQLPSALYRVRLADGGPGSRPRGRQGGRPGGQEGGPQDDGPQRASPGAAHGTVTAHLSADPRRNFVRILVGERVRVRLSPRDLTRGAIVARLGDG
jgi:translation initiation factor IF-1